MPSLFAGSGTMAMANISPLWWRQQSPPWKNVYRNKPRKSISVTHKPAFFRLHESTMHHRVIGFRWNNELILRSAVLAGVKLSQTNNKRKFLLVVYLATNSDLPFTGKTHQKTIVDHPELRVWAHLNLYEFRLWRAKIDTGRTSGTLSTYIFAFAILDRGKCDPVCEENCGNFPHLGLRTGPHGNF